MKSFIPVFLILFSSFLNSQTKYYTFSELKGMEDQSGNSHLFYRMYYKQGNPGYEETSNSIYHLDLKNNIDSLFLSDGSEDNPVMSWASGSIDLNFFNHDPSKYIYIGISCGIDCDGDIVKYDGTRLNFGIDLPTYIGISDQNDSLLYIGTFSQRSYVSKDGGKSADLLNDTVSFYSLYPYNDKIVFGNYKGNLAKSTDGGVTFIPLNYSLNTQSNYVMQYDKDKLHIYLLNYKGLLVSSDIGRMWEEKYLLPSHPYNIAPYISIDKSISGSIYLAFDKNIFHSTNYGNSFSLYKKLDHDIIGIYKKLNSYKLYAATKYKLVEITGDSIKVLKQLPLDPKILNYYPLEVGNKWIYNSVSVSYDIGGPVLTRLIVTREVTGDTVMNNGEKYFIVKDFDRQINYERIDSANGEIFRYTPDSSISNNEYVVDDLSAEVGDTINTEYYTRFGGRFGIFLEESNITLFDTSFSTREYLAGESLGMDHYSLIQGIGLSGHSFQFDFGYASDSLKGAVINGIVYGDTTITDVKDRRNVPGKFILYQNYPNPFNPTTTIRYTIPTSPPAPLLRKERGIVTLKVYDVLGRSVSTLVNKIQGPGNYEVEWNAKNYSSGIYFYQIRAGDFIATMKMLLIK